MDATTSTLAAQVSSYPDVVFLIALFIVFILYGLLRGVKASSELALAIPIAAFVYSVMPYSLGWGEPAIFGLITLVSAWVLARDTSGLDDSREFFKVALASAGSVGLLLVISAGIVDFSTLYTFGTKTLELLASAQYKFYITAVSLIAIALSRKV
jgi:hypothetical protein